MFRLCFLSFSFSPITVHIMSIVIFFPLLLSIALLMSNQIDGNRTVAPSSNVTCSLKHGEKILHEGQEISVENKLYRVEDCHLQRAYQTCSTHLWFMLNIVCQAIEQHKNRMITRPRRFARQKLLTEACCENACTVAEMSRYCP